MSAEKEAVLVKITAAGTVSIPKQYRRYMDMQKGDRVWVVLGEDGLFIKKATIS